MVLIFILIFTTLCVVQSKNSINSDDIFVYLIPHSHCDVGWVQTVSDYYTKNVTKIISSVVIELTKDKTKTFVWSETIWLKYWMKDLSVPFNLKSDMLNLIKTQQLQFVGGGMVQNDEALPNYAQIIDNLSDGHLYLRQWGALPEASWQIDPFGASQTFMKIIAESGFKYHVLDRVDDRFKSSYSFINGSGSYETEKLFQFYWGYLFEGEARKVFVNILNDFYTTPEYYYFNETSGKTEVEGFNFEGDPKINPPITDQNVQQRAGYLYEAIKKSALTFRVNHVMIPFGGDFRFQNAGVQFNNMDKLIKEINSNATMKMKIKYSTPSQYFDYITTKFISVFPINERKDDYFPLATCWASDMHSHFNNCVAYWSGCFSSYPQEMKILPRKLYRLLKSTEMLYSLSQTNNRDVPGFQVLEKAREISAIMTHHDAITGTSTFEVREDYYNMMEDSFRKLQELGKKSISNLFGKTLQYELSSLSVGFDYIPLIVFSQFGWISSDITCFRVPSGDIQKSIKILEFNDKWSSPPFQIAKNELCFESNNIPALGFKTFFIVENSTDPQVVNEIECTGDLVNIDNNVVSVQFVKKDGIYQLSTITNKQTQVTYNITMSLRVYDGFMDGAYIFTPMDYSKPFVTKSMKRECKMTLGNVVKTIYQRMGKSELTFAMYYQGNGQIDTIEVGVYIDGISEKSEVVLRFETDIENNGVIFSDSNGFNLLKRERKTVFDDQSISSAVAGSFFPISNFAKIHDEKSMFNLYTKQAVGVSYCSYDGCMEVQINRNSAQDDGRGVGEKVKITRPSHHEFAIAIGKNKDLQWSKNGFIYEYEYSVFFDTSKNPYSLNDYPKKNSKKMSYKPINELEDNIHIISLKHKNSDTGEILFRLNDINQVESYDLKESRVDISQLFNTPYEVTDSYEYSLTFLKKIKSESVAVLKSNSIKTFIITLEKKSEYNFFEYWKWWIIIGCSIIVVFLFLVCVAITASMCLIRVCTRSKKKDFHYQRIQVYEVNN